MNFYLAQVQIRSSGYTFSSRSTPVPAKNLYRWKMLQIYDTFPTLLAKTSEKFFASRSAIEFLLRQPWKLTNGFAFVLVVKNDLQCFWKLLPERFLSDFVKVCLALWKSRKYFSIKAKQFFNQTDLEVVVSLWTKMLSKLIFDCRTRFRNDWVGKCNTTFKHRLDLESTTFFGSIGLLVQPQNFPKVFVIEMLVL